MSLSVLSILRLTVNLAAVSDLSFPIKELINRFEKQSGNGLGKGSLGPEGRKINSHNLTPLRGWVYNTSKTPGFGRGYTLTALRAYFTSEF
jgi:hypothetical protein